jgi:hypothetical protein
MYHGLWFQLRQDWWLSAMISYADVDGYGVPLKAFGVGLSPAFFEILGRIVVVNGQIEYLKSRLAHLPSTETEGVRKVEQFLKRCDSGRMDRNAIVHSKWVFGAHRTDPTVILGVRYKIGKQASGEVATVSIRDIPGDEERQDLVQYRLKDLRSILKRDVATMHIGEVAYAEVMLTWAAGQLSPLGNGHA